ncbi:MAG TPA: hypothetical protein VEX38_10930, partial [Fimbriimonadaceae bacterium]|nr:hypothetical protein [Fimbriimonadaceae bacterium]
ANITLERGWNPDCVAAVTLVNDVLQRQIDRRSGSIIILDNDGEVARAGLSEIKGVTVTFPSAGNLRRSEDPYQVSISFLGLVSQLKGVLPGSLLTHREQAAKAALSQTRSLTVGILNSDETQTPLSVSGFGGFSATERRVPVDMVEDIELLDLSNIKLQHGAQDRSRLSAWESDVKTASAAHEPVAWERAFRTLVITYWVGSRYQTQLHLTCFPISRVDVGGTSEVEYAVDKARFVVLPLAP